MRILFTICGRAGSKGIKNKNIREFVGKPLPYYSISAVDLYLKRNKELEYDIVINSDSELLLKMMIQNPLREVACIKREPILSGDTVGKMAVIRNCLEVMKSRTNSNYDLVVDLDITSPIRRVCDIENLINTHIQKKADVTTSVVPARRNPYFNQVWKTKQGLKTVIESNYTARQQAPEIFDMNASLYAYSPDFLLYGEDVFDGYCEMIEMLDTGVLDLDHETDFELLEIIAEYLYNCNHEYGEIRDNIKM